MQIDLSPMAGHIIMHLLETCGHKVEQAKNMHAGSDEEPDWDSLEDALSNLGSDPADSADVPETFMAPAAAGAAGAAGAGAGAGMAGAARLASLASLATPDEKQQASNYRRAHVQQCARQGTPVKFAKSVRHARDIGEEEAKIATRVQMRTGCSFDDALRALRAK